MAQYTFEQKPDSHEGNGYEVPKNLHKALDAAGRLTAPEEGFKWVLIDAVE